MRGSSEPRVSSVQSRAPSCSGSLPPNGVCAGPTRMLAQSRTHHEGVQGARGARSTHPIFFPLFCRWKETTGFSACPGCVVAPPPTPCSLSAFMWRRGRPRPPSAGPLAAALPHQPPCELARGMCASSPTRVAPARPPALRQPREHARLPSPCRAGPTVSTRARALAYPAVRAHPHIPRPPDGRQLRAHSPTQPCLARRGLELSPNALSINPVINSSCCVRRVHLEAAPPPMLLLRPCHTRRPPLASPASRSLFASHVMC